MATPDNGAVSKVNSSTDKLVADFNAVVKDSEELLRSLAALGGEKTAALRSSAEANLQTARARLGEMQGVAIERGRAAAMATDEYVHSNPWQSIGLAAMVAGIAGFVIGIMTSRR